MRVKILLAEDELSLGQIVKESLEMRNFEVIYCENGEVALAQYEKEKPELLVLDVMMPKVDGFTVAKQIREIDKKIPIIFLTSKSQTQDVIDGFRHGGNDYLKKPFSMEELIVRMNSLLERIKLQQNEEAILIGKYVFNRKTQILLLEDQEQPLTHKENELLYHLSESRNDVLDRTMILKKLWGDDDFFTARSMDVFITKLRKKLSADTAIQILNVRGHGYKLVC
jgi:DNA-binding response OmpR family regulator